VRCCLLQGIAKSSRATIISTAIMVVVNTDGRARLIRAPSEMARQGRFLISHTTNVIARNQGKSPIERPDRRERRGSRSWGVKSERGGPRASKEVMSSEARGPAAADNERRSADDDELPGRIWGSAGSARILDHFPLRAARHESQHKVAPDFIPSRRVRLAGMIPLTRGKTRRRRGSA